MHCMMVIWWRWWISKYCISQTLVGLGRLRIVSVSAAARELKCCWIFLFNKWKVLPLMDGFPFITLPPNIFIKWYAVSHEYSTLCFMKACYLHKWYTYIYTYSTWDICGYPIASQAIPKAMGTPTSGLRCHHLEGSRTTTYVTVAWRQDWANKTPPGRTLFFSVVLGNDFFFSDFDEGFEVHDFDCWDFSDFWFMMIL